MCLIAFARRAQHALPAWLSRQAEPPDPRIDTEPLFTALADTTPAADVEFPDTGLGRNLERRRSPPLVMGDTYGTRCSTPVLASCSGIDMSQRRFGANQIANGSGELVQCEA